MLRAHREIVVVLIAFVALGILYSVTTPLFEAPDEQWHFAFVQHVATGRGLPVQSEKPTHLARQEGSQPPLYYLLAAVATFWIDTSNYPDIVWENPHYGYNVPGVVNDNKNLFIHTALESFPYRDAALAIHIARLLSVLMGALAVLFTYLLSLEIFPERKLWAASAAAFVAFVPQFLFVSSAVSNDSTIVAMSALALWLIVRQTTRTLFVRDRRPQTEVVLLGVACGLAAIAKVSGLGLAVLAVLVLIIVCWRPLKWDADKRESTLMKNLLDPRFSASIRVLIVFGIFFALVAGWWYVRNFILYGELTGTAMMTRIFGARETPLTFAQLLVQLREVWETFWVGFGWGNIRANPMVYTALGILVLISVIGWLIRIRIRIRIRNSQFAILIAWIAIMLVALINWMQTTQAPHGRLFFPALPAIAILVVSGLASYSELHLSSRLSHFPHHVARIMPFAFSLFLFVCAILAPFAIIQPAYAFPPSLSATDTSSIAHRIEITYGDQMKLLGYDLSLQRVLPGESLMLTLDWQALAQMDADYSIGIHVIDANGRVVSARDSYPGHGMLPTRLWYAGQMIRDAYWLPISVEAASGVAQIQVSLYTREDKHDLPAFDPQAQAITPVIGRVKIGAPNLTVPRVQHPTDFVFGKQIALVGYDVNRASNVSATLYWKRIAPMANDYTVFVHVFDSAGNKIAQRDQQPQAGKNPTSFWDDGEIVADVYDLSASQGASQIRVGLYRAETGERLMVMDGKGNVVGDYITLSVESRR